MSQRTYTGPEAITDDCVVELQNGVIKRHKVAVYSHLGHSVGWRGDGSAHTVIGTQLRDFDIIKNYGPLEVDHGDGATTKIVTLPVTAERDCWGHRAPRCVERSGMIRWDFKEPTPDPNLLKLVEAMEAGTVEIPSRAKTIARKTKNSTVYLTTQPLCGQVEENLWSRRLYGDIAAAMGYGPFSCDLDEARRLVAERKGA